MKAKKKPKKKAKQKAKKKVQRAANPSTIEAMEQRLLRAITEAGDERQERAVRANARYVPLSALFPNTNRVTLWRWRRAGKIPKPDLVVGSREFYIDRPLPPPADATKAA